MTIRLLASISFIFIAYWHWAFSETSPTFLLIFLRKKAVNSRDGSPNAGGHSVTRLEKSYNVFFTGMVQTLTCIEGNNLSMNYLESMRVVVNIGGIYGILEDDEVTNRRC